MRNIDSSQHSNRSGTMIYTFEEIERETSINSHFSPFFFFFFVSHLLPNFYLHHAQTTQLHEAVRHGHLEVVQYLIDNGADINDATGDDSTPLRIAINSFGSDHEISKLLSDMGAEDRGKVEEYDEEYDDDDDDDDDDTDEYDEEDDDDKYHHHHRDEEPEETPAIVTEATPEVVPTIVKIQAKWTEVTPEVVPAIINMHDDDEEL